MSDASIGFPVITATAMNIIQKYLFVSRIVHIYLTDRGNKNIEIVYIKNIEIVFSV